MILEFIILIVLKLTCVSLIMAAWEKQKLKNYYKQIEELEDDDKSRN